MLDGTLTISFFRLSFFWQAATFRTIVGKNEIYYHYIVVITTILLFFSPYRLVS